MKRLKYHLATVLLVALFALSATSASAANSCKHLSMTLHKSAIAMLTGHRTPCHFEIVLLNEGGQYWYIEGKAVRPLILKPVGSGCIVSRKSLLDIPRRFNWTLAGMIKVIGKSCTVRISAYEEPTDYQWVFYISRAKGLQ